MLFKIKQQKYLLYIFFKTCLKQMFNERNILALYVKMSL